MDPHFTSNSLGAGICKILIRSGKMVKISDIMKELNITFDEAMKCLLVMNTTVKLEFETFEDRVFSVGLK